MSEDRKCPDCETAMEAGFIPDMASGASALQMGWHPGEAEGKRFIGMKAGVKFDKNAMVPITAFRCPQCGLVRLYVDS